VKSIEVRIDDTPLVDDPTGGGGEKIDDPDPNDENIEDDPDPTEDDPDPTEDDPDPTEDDPDPTEDDPDPTEDDPYPTEDDPEPDESDIPLYMVNTNSLVDSPIDKLITFGTLTIFLRELVSFHKSIYCHTEMA
jgi:hypothetical protein